MGESDELEAMTDQEILAYRAFLQRLNESKSGVSGPGPEPGGLGERYRYILESLRAFTLDIAPDGTVAYVSSSITTVLGYAPEEWIGRSGHALLHPDDQANLGSGAQAMRESGGALQGTARLRHKDGRYIWMEASATRAQDYPGGPTFSVLFFRDISARMRTTDELVEHQDRLRALTENASDIIAEVDSDGRVHYLSPSFEATLGRKSEEILGKTFAEIGIAENLHPEDFGDLSERYTGGLGAGDARQTRLAYRFRHADGSWHWFESETRPYYTRNGELRKVIVSRDVTDRIEALARLKESEERYRILAESTRDIIVEVDSRGHILYMSPNVEDILGSPVEFWLGTTGASRIHPDDFETNRATFRKAAESTDPVQFTSPYRIRHSDGSWRWFEGTAVAFHRAGGKTRVLTVTRDVTERQLAEEQRRELEENLRQVQKLEGLGVMAGGIAHDFNNLLTPILGNASLALLDLPENSPVRSRIEKIRGAALRAAALTNQMLAYAGARPVEVEAIDLSRVVRELSQLLESSISGQTTVVYHLADDLPSIQADDAQLGQVVMNLLTNAVESVGEGAGAISITTGTTEVDAAHPPDTVFGGRLEPGTYVFLDVRDNGCGMDAQTRSRIFDPFFTTKFTGRGLGLAAVMGVVRGHNGAIVLESEVGRGTRFQVLFPCTSEVESEEAPPSTRELLWRGSGTVLVVDDDDAVRELTAEGLRRFGLTVLTAANGREGIAIFDAHRDEIRVVLLDRTMPEVSGEEAFDAIRRIDPKAKVLLVSGYSEEQAAERFADRGLVGFLQKPFRLESLIQKVREAIGE